MSRNHDTIEAIAAILAVGAAVWLAIVTGLLHKATRNLADSTEDLARGASTQVDEMREARKLADKQHDLAEKQFLLAGRSADLAEKQHGLQREQFFASHRPRIAIRSLILSMKGDSREEYFRCFFTNRGDTTAIIDAVNIVTTIRYEGFYKSPAIGADIKAGTKLIPAQAIQVDFTVDEIIRQEIIGIYILDKAVVILIGFRHRGTPL